MVNRGNEIRCYIRAPDGHLIEVGSLVGRVEASKLTAMTMTLNHIHLRVRDLNAAVIWFEKVLQFHPGFRNERMATFSFNSMTLIFDAAGDDVSATVGFKSDNCDRD